MVKPIYIVTGFLDSGKTMAIKRTLLDPRFTEYEKTLIICFEEGDEEYDEEFLRKTHSVVEYLDFKDFDGRKLNELDKKHRMDRVFIEFNGMDDDSILLNMELPRTFEIAQMICTIDASKFKLHVANMPQFMFNHVSSTEIVVLNRSEGQDYRSLRNKIKSMNQYAVIGLEDIDGNMSEMPLTDLFDKDNLDISDADYGLFYMDALDNFAKYDGCPLKFNAFFLEEIGGKKVFGRYAMVCCNNDMQRLGMNVLNLKDKLELGGYYHVEGIFRAVREGSGIRVFVDGLKAEPCPRPEMEYVTFN
ncbi:MAG: GTP-binding protein [Erysipelotrichaceae bacterium]|nr:GTP-binding protein [Erysipelotrichaceae bacterium]